MPFKNPDVRRRYERERLRKLRAAAASERAAEAAEQRARGLADHGGDELAWLTTRMRERWAGALERLRREAEWVPPGAPVLPPHGGNDGRSRRRATRPPST
jgi:hypothetical protein